MANEKILHRSKEKHSPWDHYKEKKGHGCKIVIKYIGAWKFHVIMEDYGFFSWLYIYIYIYIYIKYVDINFSLKLVRLDITLVCVKNDIIQKL